MAPDRKALRFVADYYTMRAEKYGVLSGLVQSRSVFLLTGYVPEDRARKLEKLLKEQYDSVVEFADPEEMEDVPVLLHNNKFVEPVEGVIESYSLPGRGEMDPSPVLLCTVRSDAFRCSLRTDYDRRLRLLPAKA